MTLTGTGFTAGSQAACPAIADTTFVSPTQLTVQIPSDLDGPDGGTTPIGVFVMNADGATSGVQLFTVNFPASMLQSWTSIANVCGELPGFQRGGQISDDQIQNWIISIAQMIASAMLRRGLPPVVAWCRDYFGTHA